METDFAMPLSKEHKARTRARIVDSARRLFKTRGYDGVGIDAIMADAGLTRGGFYAHFDSKEALFVEAVGEIVLAAGLRHHETEGTAEPAGWRQHIVDYYLSKEHRDHENGGCPMAALSAYVARTGDDVREVYTDVVRDLAAALGERMPDGHPEPDKAAMATIAQCVGAMLIARAVNDEAIADRMFDASRWATRKIARVGVSD